VRFYALHKFNTVVERGEFDYANLPKIYALALVAKMTPEERAYFARVTAVNAEAVKAEKQRIQEVKENTIKKLLLQGKLSIEDIADANDVSIDTVLGVQRSLPKN
jgi:predicted transposase YdaD